MESDVAKSDGDGGLRTAWILGSSRSGSTWLLRMLSELPNVVGIDETHIGHHLGVWRPISLAWATADDEPQLTTYREIKRSRTDYLFSDRYRHIWEPALARLVTERLSAQVAELAPAIPDPVVVVKEPGGSEVADLIVSLLPKTRLLFLLRDGRDVVDSWLDAYRPGTWARHEGTYSLRGDSRLAFIRWQAAVWSFRTRAVQRAYEMLPEARRVFLRYEDLIGEPEAELGRLAQALDLEVDPEQVRDVVARHRYWSVPPGERGSGRRIRWAEPGRWRSTMTEEEIAAMAEIMDPILVDYGYAPTRSLSLTTDP